MSKTEDAKAGEIEITPEMIEAGVRALRAEYEPFFESEADGVRKIYVAMRGALSKPSFLDHQDR